jgi:muconolactone delta-isomerase
MKILALEKELSGATSEQFQPFLKEEARSVWELQQAGVLREAYFHAEAHTAVLVLECPDQNAARQALASLPLVKAGLIEFELIPLAPYDGYARLFARPDPTQTRGEASHEPAH